MRLWILSDLHLEFAPLKQPLVPPAADVCVVAGDLCRNPVAGVRWLAEHVAPVMPCVYIAGNHEFYKGSIVEGIQAGRAAAQEFPNVHFLENDTVTIAGVRFFGTTLWTDFRIEKSPEWAMANARERMNDYRAIAWRKKPWQRFLPFHAQRMHQESRRFIETALKADSVTTVVVTHHLPHARSIPPRFQGDPLNAAYASDLSSVIEAGAPALWVHGHAHENCDYVIMDTRIVSNPRGYADENKTFDAMLVVCL